MSCRRSPCVHNVSQRIFSLDYVTQINLRHAIFFLIWIRNFCNFHWNTLNLFCKSTITYICLICWFFFYFQIQAVMLEVVRLNWEDRHGNKGASKWSSARRRKRHNFCKCLTSKCMQKCSFWMKKNYVSFFRS